MAKAKANDTIRMDPSGVDLSPDGELLCNWAEKSASLLMQKRQEEVSEDKMLSTFLRLIKDSDAYESWRDLALVLANNLVIATYSSDKVDKSKIMETSRDYGVWIYNECLQGYLIDWEEGTFAISSVISPKLKGVDYSLNKNQKMLCDWVEENSTTIMKHRYAKYSKSRVSQAFKRKVRDNLHKGDDIKIWYGVIDLIVDGAYKSNKVPLYLRTIMANNYGIHNYNECVSGRIFSWK